MRTPEENSYKNILEQTLRPLIYGKVVELDIDDQQKQVVMKLNDSNYTFLEFVSSSFKILKSFSLYTLKEVIDQKIEDNFGYFLQFRMRNIQDNFTLKFSNIQEQEEIKKMFEVVLNHLKKLPYAEFSVKNLVRNILQNSKIANVGNIFTLEDLQKMLHHLRIKLEIEDLNKLIRKTVQNTDQLNQFDFRRIFKVLMLREELGESFKELLDIGEYEKIGKLTITLENLLYWLKEKQGQKNINEQKVRNFFIQIKSPNIFSPLNENLLNENARVLGEEEKQKFEINFEEFCNYVYSPINSIIDYEKQEQKIDTSKSLSNYFIKGSHDSYLIDYQNNGEISIEGYRRAIENGCRYIELDCFDGQEGPVISHDKTFAQQISIEELLDVLKDIAFKYTDLPLILNVELNCTVDNRNKIAELLHKFFGNSLNTLNKDSFKLEELPTLEELKNKILLLCKTSYPNFITQQKTKETQKKIHQEPIAQYTTFYLEDYNEGGLRTIFGFSSMNEAKMNELGWNQVSVNSTIDFHQKYMNFAHPDLNRDDFLNYNPVLAWNLGIQVAALKMINQDIYNSYNNGFFQKCRNEGYLLKPELLMKKELVKEREDPLKEIQIKIIASQIEKQHLVGSDFIFCFVEISVDGKEIDKLKNPKLNSKIFQNNLFHSNFEAEKEEMKILKIFYPELAFLIFDVIDAKTGFKLKSNVVSFDSMRSGVRVVPLLDKFSIHDSMSYLLVDIKIIDLEKKEQVY